MRKQRSILFSIITLSAITLSSCAKRFDYTIENQTPDSIEAVNIAINDSYRFLHGVIPAAKGKSAGGATNLTSENLVTITWVDVSGTYHTKQLTVSTQELQDDRHLLFAIRPTDEIAKAWRFD